MLKVSSRFNPTVHLGSLSFPETTWKKTVYVAMGILSSLCWKSSSAQKVAFAANDDSLIQHAVEEILGHFIWEKIGHFTGIGHFASGLLGALFTFQQLGEKDSFNIPRAIPKPTAAFALNPATNKVEYCIILANEKQLFGQDIIKFYQDLQFMQCIPSQPKK